MKVNMRNPIFSFCLIRGGAYNACGLETVKNICSYTLHTDSRTPLQYAEQGGREIIIFGYAVDVFSGLREKLAENILKSSDKLADVIEYEKKLGGKYVIFYAENGRCYCIGDATCSVPVFYSVGLTDSVCCSNPKIIMDSFDLKPDKYLQEIRDSGPLNQAMPYDVTPTKK